MIRRCICLLFLTLLWALPLAAQEPAWVAWLYDSRDGRMTLVSSSGSTAQEFFLPRDRGDELYSYSVAVSGDGTRIAYSITNPGEITTFLIYDTLLESVVTRHEAGQVFYTTLDLPGANRVFNEFGSAAAFGYSRLDDSWEIVVLDVLGDRVAFRLSSGNPAAAVVSEGYLLTPLIRHYTGTTISFTPAALGTEGIAESASYDWDLLSGAVMPSDMFPSMLADVLMPTGEFVMPVLDMRLPNRLDSLPMPYQLNALHVYQPEQGARFPFFASAGWSFGPSYFVEAGQRVLATAFSLESEQVLFPLIDRSGLLLGYAPITPDVPTSIRGVEQGFIYTAAVPAGTEEVITLFFVDTRGPLSSGLKVWADSHGGRPQLVWAADISTTERAPFLPWQQLAAPILVPAEALFAPSVLPTPTVLIGGFLAVGGRALINTTEGDRLNMRSGPGTSFEIVARLDNGTLVSLLEGPRASDGFIWWRVRLTDGTEGWVVQSADDVRTLLPLE